MWYGYCSIDGGARWRRVTIGRSLGQSPKIYDRYLVPLTFDSYALYLAPRLAEANPLDVLETAAGTGVLTRAIASRLPVDARIVATDLNQPMLDRAKARQSDGRIEWKQADALALPVENQSFDVVACQFGVMFFPDKVQGYLEAWRVLKPGGRFLFNVWDRISENEFADTVTEARICRPGARGFHRRRANALGTVKQSSQFGYLMPGHRECPFRATSSHLKSNTSKRKRT
jgi:SAM-dependent methyltransferase